MIFVTVDELANQCVQELSPRRGWIQKLGLPEVKTALKEAAVLAATDTQTVETTYTVATVAGTDEYQLPDDVLLVEAVLWDNYRMQEMSWYEWSQKTGDGQSASTQGDPRWYMIWGEGTVPVVKLYEIPGEAKTLTIHYRRRPTMKVRDFTGLCTSVGTTTTLVSTEILSFFGAVSNRGASSTFFNGCQVRIPGTGAAPQGESSRITGYDESNGTLTFSPAMSALVPDTTKFQIQDVLEIPHHFAPYAKDYAKSRILRTSTDKSDLAQADRFENSFHEGRMRLLGEGNVRTKPSIGAVRVME